MIHSLTVIDNFAPDPEEIRQYGLTLNYEDVPVFDGHPYPGFQKPDNPAFTEMYQRMMERRLQMQVRIDHQAFIKSDETHQTQQWIHSDAIGSTHATVHYLFHENGHGTSFWQHRDTKMDDLREVAGLASDPDHAKEIVAMMGEQGNEEAYWRLTDKIDSRWNRFIAYPASRFHSRSNRNGFGNGENSRLVLATFFTV